MDMRMKSIVYSANTSSQNIDVNGSVNFGTPIRRNGIKCNVFNDGIIEGAGLYKIIANLLVESTDGEIAVIALYKDGLQIPGTKVTIQTTETSLASVTIPSLVRNGRSKESAITAIVTVGTVKISNATLIIEKI